MVKNPEILSEQCRKSMGRYIIQRFLNEGEELPVIAFDRSLEDILSGGLVHTENGSSYLNLDGHVAQDILQKLIKSVESFSTHSAHPILVISSKLRLAFFRLIYRYLPHLTVISYDEIPTNVHTKTLELIS